MVDIRIKSFDSLPSTNDECMKAALNGDSGGLWIQAYEQTKGRGRQGRIWQSGTGNLYISTLLIDPCELRSTPQLSFLASLAVFDTAKTLTNLSFPDIALKWPNDLHLKGAKFSGILLEMKPLEPPRKSAVVIGFGINIISAPEAMPYPVAALSDFNSEIVLSDVQDLLIENFYKYLLLWNGRRFSVGHTFDEEPDFSKIKEIWERNVKGLGENITIRLNDLEKKGIFEGIDEHGRLKLRYPAGNFELISAGDLFFTEKKQ